MKQIVPENYDDYRKAQVDANRKKRGNVWARRDIIRDLASILPGRGYGICHGIRNGREVELFSESLPDWKWDGTDIAPVDGDAVQLDFHATLPCIYDCVYSNSLDHSRMAGEVPLAPLDEQHASELELSQPGADRVRWKWTPSISSKVAPNTSVLFVRLCGHVVQQRKYDGQRRVYALRPFEGGRQ